MSKKVTKTTVQECIKFDYVDSKFNVIRLTEISTGGLKEERRRTYEEPLTCELTITDFLRLIGSSKVNDKLIKHLIKKRGI